MELQRVWVSTTENNAWCAKWKHNHTNMPPRCKLHVSFTGFVCVRNLQLSLFGSLFSFDFIIFIFISFHSSVHARVCMTLAEVVSSFWNFQRKLCALIVMVYSFAFSTFVPMHPGKGSSHLTLYSYCTYSNEVKEMSTSMMLTIRHTFNIPFSDPKHSEQLSLSLLDYFLFLCTCTHSSPHIFSIPLRLPISWHTCVFFIHNHQTRPRKL